MNLKLIRFLFSFLEKYLPSIGSKFGVKLFLTPIRKPIKSKHDNLLVSAQKSRLMVDGFQITVRKWGSGPEIIMVHGWSHNGLSFGQFINAFTQCGFSVLLPDMIGHGESEGKSSGAFFFRNAVIELLKKHPNCHALIGHSLGGLASIMSLNKYPNNVRKLVTIGMPVYLDQVLSHFTTKVGAGSQIKMGMWQLLKQRYMDEKQAFSAYELIDELPNTINFQIVHDTSDSEVPFSNAEELFSKGGTCLLTTENLGHGGALYHRETINKIVAFVCENPT